MRAIEMNTDMIRALAHLADRAGARTMQIGYLHDDVPTEQAAWYASVEFGGARLIAQQHASPTAAAQALAERILAGADCRCGKPVTLVDEQPGCRWQLRGARWEPSCDAPPLRVHGRRGDLAAMRRAFDDRTRP